MIIIKSHALTQVIAGGLLASPALAWAHLGDLPHSHGSISGWDALLTGMVHPLTGLDHLIFILALGLWAATAGKLARFAVVGTFAWLMSLGAIVGLVVSGLPMIEILIATSLVAVGGVLATGRKLNLGLGLSLAGAFALVHGYAHGAEIGQALALPYFAGFLLSFLVLSALAISAGHYLIHARQERVLRPVGGLVAAVGCVFLLGTL